MNDKNKTNQEESAIVTMCLTGYRDTIKKLTYTLYAVIFGWACTVGGFLYYLSQYDVKVTSYGTVENSRINADNGIFEQQAQSITNNGIGVKEYGSHQK